MLVGPPALVETEIGEHEFLGGKAAVSGRQGGPNAVVAESYDVGLAVAVDVGDEADVFIRPPALVETDVGEHELLWGKAAVSRRQGGPDAGVAEPHDVGPAVVVDVGEELDVLVGPPALVEAEIGEHELLGGKASVSRRERGPNAGVAEPHDVRPAVVVDVGQYARVRASHAVRGARDVTAIRSRRQESEVGRACCKVSVIVVSDEAQADGIGNVRRIGGGGPEHELPSDLESCVGAVNGLQAGDQLPDEAGIAPSDCVDLVGFGRPQDHIRRRAQASPRAEKVPTDARLARADESQSIAEAFAVAAIENPADRLIGAMPVLVQHDIRVGGVDATIARLKEIKRTSVPERVATVSYVDARRQLGKSIRRQKILGERVRAIGPYEGACLRQFRTCRGIQREIDGGGWRARCRRGDLAAGDIVHPTMRAADADGQRCGANACRKCIAAIRAGGGLAAAAAGPGHKGVAEILRDRAGKR